MKQEVLYVGIQLAFYEVVGFAAYRRYMNINL